MPHESERIVATAVAARGGLLGKPLLAVLIVSVAAAVGAMALSYAGAFATS
jgi:hypothetical protein